jgi:hypothetical protein
VNWALAFGVDSSEEELSHLIRNICIEQKLHDGTCEFSPDFDVIAKRYPGFGIGRSVVRGQFPRSGSLAAARGPMPQPPISLI